MQKCIAFFVIRGSGSYEKVSTLTHKGLMRPFFLAFETLYHKKAAADSSRLYMKIGI